MKAPKVLAWQPKGSSLYVTWEAQDQLASLSRYDERAREIVDLLERAIAAGTVSVYPERFSGSPPLLEDRKSLTNSDVSFLQLVRDIGRKKQDAEVFVAAYRPKVLDVCHRNQIRTIEPLHLPKDAASYHPELLKLAEQCTKVDWRSIVLMAGAVAVGIGGAVLVYEFAVAARLVRVGQYAYIILPFVALVVAMLLFWFRFVARAAYGVFELSFGFASMLLTLNQLQGDYWTLETMLKIAGILYVMVGGWDNVNTGSDGKLDRLIDTWSHRLHLPTRL